MDTYRAKLIEDIKILVDKIHNVRVLMHIHGMLKSIHKKSSY